LPKDIRRWIPVDDVTSLRPSERTTNSTINTIKLPPSDLKTSTGTVNFALELSAWPLNIDREFKFSFDSTVTPRNARHASLFNKNAGSFTRVSFSRIDRWRKARCPFMFSAVSDGERRFSPAGGIGQVKAALAHESED
jgi:hypothetical protein